MRADENASVRLKVGRYLLEKIKEVEEDEIPAIPADELMDNCGVNNGKELGSILKTYRDMFVRNASEIYPSFSAFGGREDFLEHLSFIVRALENPTNREGWAKSPGIESGFHRSSFGSRRRL